MFETGSDDEKIDKIEKQLDDILDSQITSVGGNDNVSIDSTRGARNDAGGDAGGVRSSQPVIHQITDVDEDNVSTGVYDKIDLVSSMIIVDYFDTGDMELRYIQGTAKDGATLKITPKEGRTLIIKSTGNILTSSDITITDTEVYELIKYSAAETMITGGAYKIFKTGSASGSFLPVSGGTMLGPIAYDPDVVVVDFFGRVAITSSYMQSLGSGSPDTIFYFDGALFNGQRLEYQVTNQTIQIIKSMVFLAISNIVGNGVDSVITVTVPSTSLLATGEQVNILDTTNFNANDVTITITGATTFTYNLGSIGSATPETSGNVQRGNIITPDDADLILDSTLSAQGVAIGNFIFDPSVPAGGAWRLESSTVSSGGSGSQTPWTQTIEGSGYTLNQPGKIIIKPIQTDGLEGILELVRNDVTPVTGDIGTILFKGKDDMNADVVFGSIQFESNDIGETTKESSFEFRAQNTNTLKLVMGYSGPTDTLDIYEDTDFHTRSILNASIDTALIDSGILPMTRGGTGISAVSAGDLMYAPLSAWSKLSIGTAGKILRVSSSNLPAWETLALGELSNVVAPSPVAGNVLTFNGSLWINQAPSISGANTALSNLTTTSVNLPLNMNGNAINNTSIDAGDIDSGTLSMARGGTGISAVSAGDLMYAPLSAWSKLSIGTLGQVLTVNASLLPIWADITFPSLALNDLSNVVVPTPAVGNVLTFNGSLWINQAPTTGEDNTASNLGVTTYGLFAQKSGVDLEFKSLLAGTNITLSSSATGITINSSGGGAFLPLAGGTMSGNIAMGSNDITGIDDLFFVSSSSTINMNEGTINMQDGEILDVKNMTIHGSGVIKLASGLAEFGIQLDTTSSVIGSAGMLAMPQSVPNPVPTVAELDGLFGNHKGAMGVDTGLVPHLFIRSNVNTWYRFNVTSIVTV